MIIGASSAAMQKKYGQAWKQAATKETKAQTTTNTQRHTSTTGPSVDAHVLSSSWT